MSNEKRRIDRRVEALKGGMLEEQEMKGRWAKGSDKKEKIK